MIRSQGQWDAEWQTNYLTTQINLFRLLNYSTEIATWKHNWYTWSGCNWRHKYFIFIRKPLGYLQIIDDNIFHLYNIFSEYLIYWVSMKIFIFLFVMCNAHHEKWKYCFCQLVMSAKVVVNKKFNHPIHLLNSLMIHDDQFVFVTKFNYKFAWFLYFVF